MRESETFQEGRRPRPHSRRRRRRHPHSRGGQGRRGVREDRGCSRPSVCSQPSLTAHLCREHRSLDLVWAVDLGGSVFEFGAGIPGPR
ncbi:hypothetical protein Acr_00g0074620 [Actinidia rufa]|uniref:Uncharacterized protein n=1 Tax=Actinidia rufa TaxID=165716 RepID=A0A7J0DTR3_9ERIC|nr:hypothetical protein Acr_00g0074620 [Actinidia rufa]